jgi:hypothetical protein
MNELLITPLMEQQMFDDWCPYTGNPDPRTVWSAAIEAVNGLHLTASQPKEPEQEPQKGGCTWCGGDCPQFECDTHSTWMNEPVAFLHECRKKPELKVLSFKKNAPELSTKGYKATPLGYLTSPQRKPLTRAVVWKLWCDAKFESAGFFWLVFARAIEAAHGIKE